MNSGRYLLFIFLVYVCLESGGIFGFRFFVSRVFYLSGGDSMFDDTFWFLSVSWWLFLGLVRDRVIFFVDYGIGDIR